MTTRTTWLLALGGAALTSLVLPAPPRPALGSTDPSQAVNRVRVPPQDVGVRFLESRRQSQLESTAQFQVFHAFGFSDRLLESGITFRHRSVEDATKFWIPVHYDHGNGIAAADVDDDGLIDLYFTSQIGANQLWKNLGDGTFRDITASAGVSLAERISVTASFADLDNDGDADLYVTTVRGGNALFRNDGKGSFTDVSRASGTDYLGHSSGTVIFDYDRDGLLDLFVTNVGVYTNDQRGRGGYYRGLADAFSGHEFPERYEKSLLFRNLGGLRFREMSSQLQLEDDSWSGDATFVDLNRDLFPDLYVLSMQGDDHYYENQGGQRFVDRTAEHFPKTPWGAMGVKFFDFNNDGRMELLITDMHSDMGEDIDPPFEKLKSPITVDEPEDNIFGNAFYVQQSDGTFREMSDAMGLENYWPWGVSVDDLNADGFEDVLITSSMNFPYRYGINSLLLNDRGEKFLDSEFVLGVEPRRDGRVETDLFELDCAQADKTHRLCAGQSGPLMVVGTLGTRAAVFFDLDQDGDLDIVTNEFNDVPQVLISDLSEQRDLRYLKIRLRGVRSNRDGLGATVTVRAGEQVLTKYNDGKSGYLSQSRLPLYFGLDQVSRVDKIEVAWPAGGTQTVTPPIELGRELEIVEEP